MMLRNPDISEEFFCDKGELAKRMNEFIESYLLMPENIEDIRVRVEPFQKTGSLDWNYKTLFGVNFRLRRF